MTRVIVAGATGRVGRVLAERLPQEPDIQLVGTVGRSNAADLERLLAGADALVDFTTPEAAPPLLLAAARAGVSPVSGTSGLSAQWLDELDQALQERGVGGVWAANFAVGAVLMMHFAAVAALYMESAEIVELHHAAKLDAPSGTAIATAQAMRARRASDLPDPPVLKTALPGSRGANEGGVRIHSIRLPGLVAHQQVLLGSLGQTLSIRHDTSGREAYVPGVVLALRSLPGLVGLRRGLATLMGLST